MSVIIRARIEHIMYLKKWEGNSQDHIFIRARWWPLIRVSQWDRIYVQEHSVAKLMVAGRASDF